MAYFDSPNLNIIDHQADSRHHSGIRAIRPMMIILHATAGTNSLDWLSTSPQSSVSAHRLIDKAGRIYKILPDEYIAHHAGYGRVGPYTNLNAISLGIELENLNTGADQYPAPQVQSCAWQIAEWWAAYGAIPILTHAMVDGRKTDPRGFPWPQLYGMLFDRIRGIG